MVSVKYDDGKKKYKEQKCVQRKSIINSPGNDEGGKRNV
jgi:hypothetical protein